MLLTDNIAQHPKIVRAGELLGGPDGRAKALALYVAAIGYARHFLTDGFVPDAWLGTNGTVEQGRDVAKIFTDRRVRLFHRRAGGYVIHDFVEINGNAHAIKEKREKERARIAAFRARQKANGHS